MLKSLYLPTIPSGLKENVYFIVDNERSIDRKENGQKSAFCDDCGVWETDSGTSPKTPYLFNGKGELKKLYLRKKEGGEINEKVYCFERQVKKKRVYLPLDPQPKADEVVTVQRYYARLMLACVKIKPTKRGSLICGREG